MSDPIFDIPFWRRIWKAIERILGLACLIGLHIGLHYLVSLMEDGATFAKVLLFATYVAFAVIYAVLLFEMVGIFIPPNIMTRIRGIKAGR